MSLNSPVPSKHSEYIHFSCSLLLICGFISRSAFGLMQSSPSCSTDLSPPKLSWNIYFYNIITSINVSICMCRLTSTAMSWGMLGFLTLTISPWQGSSLAGVEQIMSPTLGTSNGPSRLNFTSWDHWSISCDLSWALGDSPGKDPHWQVLSESCPQP